MFSSKSYLLWALKKINIPFKSDSPFFFLIWIILYAPDFAISLKNLQYFDCIGFAMIYFIIAYIIDFFLNLNNIIAKFFKPIIFIICFCFTALNIYCIIFYKERITHDIIEIISATNPNEVKEYLEMYFTWSKFILFFVSIFICFILYSILKKIKNLKLLTTTKPLWFFLIMSIIFMGIYPDFKNNLGGWNFKLNEIVDLQKFSNKPLIIKTKDFNQPDNIVVIIGESFTPFHSNLYGYNKKTNPLLTQLKEKGCLFIFDNVEAPGTHTTTVFKYLLNTQRLDNLSDDSPWYKSETLIETLSEAGYHTFWLSNQYKAGRWDNVPTSHSRLCDQCFFNTEFGKEKFLDEDLIDIKINFFCHNAIFYHLMGQHYFFKERYPKSYDIFNSLDYNYQKDKSKLIAEYDNATLYNDFVVNSIINKFKNSDTILFYFSDHGLDLFESDPDYAGHAKNTKESKDIGVQIPFMIYLSPNFQELRPELVERIKNSINNKFCTDKLIYTIMDVIGIKFKNNNDVEKYSLFSFNNIQ